MNLKSKQARISSIFRPEVVNLLRKRGFTGRLKAEWENGRLVSFNMGSNVGFNMRKKDEFDDFDNIFWR